MHLGGRASVLWSCLRRMLDDAQDRTLELALRHATPENGAQGEDVRSSVDGFAPFLFGRTKTEVVRPCPGDAESRDAAGPRRLEGDSTRGDPAMDDPEQASVFASASMRVRKSESRIRDHGSDLAPGEPSAPEEHGTQRGAGQVFGRDVAGLSAHPDIQHVRDACVGESSGEVRFRCDTLETLPLSAVQCDPLLETTHPGSHGDECAADLAVAKRSQQLVRAQPRAFRRHGPIVRQLSGFVAFRTKANVVQCEPCVSRHTKRERRARSAADAANGVLKCRAAHV